MPDDLKNTILEAMEASLQAQLQAVRRLRRPRPKPLTESPKQRMSQVDMAYDILLKSRAPLHISELIERIATAFGVRPDRESLVSSLTKKIQRGDRFLRTAKNTFGLRART